MSNEEMMNKQIQDVAELFKGMFNEEELKHMEEVYKQLLVKKEMEGMLSGSTTK